MPIWKSQLQLFFLETGTWKKNKCWQEAVLQKTLYPKLEYNVVIYYVESAK